MRQRLIRFKEGPNSRRSYFINRFLVENLGKNKEELIDDLNDWEETVNHGKHGTQTLKALLSMPGQGFFDMLEWATDDFHFFSWDDRKRLTLKPVNIEICLLVDRLIECGVKMGNGKEEGSIVWAWKTGSLPKLRELAEEHLESH